MKKVILYHLITLAIWFIAIGAALFVSLTFGFALDWAAIKFCSVIMIAATVCCTIYEIVEHAKKKHKN